MAHKQLETKPINKKNNNQNNCQSPSTLNRRRRHHHHNHHASSSVIVYNASVTPTGGPCWCNLSQMFQHIQPV